MNYSVTLHIDVRDNPTTLPGHVFYELNDGTNFDYYGLYPADEKSDLAVGGAWFVRCC